MRGRRRDAEYARFLEATVGLADASTGLPRRARLGMAAAILRVCDSDRAARTALIAAEPSRLEHAAAGLKAARLTLAEAEQCARFDARRRRSLSLVADPGD